MRRTLHAVALCAVIALALGLMFAPHARAAPTYAATSTDASGSVTTGATFQTIIPASTYGSRGGCTIQNPTTATEPLLVFFGPLASATTGKAYSLAPGAAISCTIGVGVLQDAVNVTGATTGHAFTAGVQ